MGEDTGTDRLIRRLMELWPMWALLAGGLVTAIRFYNNVEELSKTQKEYRQTAEERKDINRHEHEEMRSRLLALEKDVEWLKILVNEKGGKND